MKADSVFDAIHQGILICDKGGGIVFFNKEYGHFIHRNLEDTKGCNIADIRKDAFVPKVIKDGRVREGILRKEGEQEYFASIYPIFEAGKTIGTISLVTTIGAIKGGQGNKSRTLYERVKEYEKREILQTVAYYGNTLEGKKQAAEVLGISLATLYNKLKE